MPAEWRHEFARAGLVRKADIPTAHGEWTMENLFWRDAGFAATVGQGWLLGTDEGDVMATLAGTCGVPCNIAEYIFEYVHAHFADVPPANLTFFEASSGTSSVASCLANAHDVGVTMSLTPEESLNPDDLGDDATVYHYYTTGGHGYGVQSYVSVARGAPTVLDFITADRQMPLKAGSFHAILACRAAGGAIPAFEWFWFELQRLLKPGGFFFMENEVKGSPKLPDPKLFCMEAAKAPLGIASRYFVRGKWRTSDNSLRVFRRLPLAQCPWLESLNITICRRKDGQSPSVEACLTPDNEPMGQATSVSGYASTAWEELVDQMEPWLRRTESELAVLRKQDAALIFKPPRDNWTEVDASLSIFRPNQLPPQASRVVSVLSINAADHAFATALRARASRYWGMVSGGVHATAVAPHFRSAAPDGAVVVDLCRRALPTHPRAYDIVVVSAAHAAFKPCISRLSSEAEVVELLKHLALEWLRVSRPGPLGLLVLEGHETFAGSVREAHATWGASLNVTLIGCVSKRHSHACVLRPA